MAVRHIAALALLTLTAAASADDVTPARVAWTRAALARVPVSKFDNTPERLDLRARQQEEFAREIARVSSKAPLSPKVWASLLVAQGSIESNFDSEVRRQSVSGKGGVVNLNRIELAFSQVNPTVLPANYSVIDSYANAARFIRNDSMTVISEVAEYQKRLWLHVSCAHSDKLPNWADLREVKQVFCGPKRLALSIMPSEAEYVNIHPFVLHLWCPLEHDPIPDFRRFCPELGKVAI